MEQILQTLKNFPYGVTAEQIETITCEPEAELILMRMVNTNQARLDEGLFYPFLTEGSSQ